MTFKIGNKKQSGKEKKEETSTGDWERSKCTRVDLLNLVAQGLLQSEEMVHWKPSFCQFFPQEDGKGKEYIQYSLPTNHSGWRPLWFYIGNHKPALPETTPGKAVWRGEWNEKLNENQMVQVREMLDLIAAHKETGVTSASVLAAMYKWCIMPLQKRCRFRGTLIYSGVLLQILTFLGQSIPSQNLMDRSQEKSEKLKFIEDGHRKLAEKDKRINDEIRKRIDLCNELKQLKKERTRETWLMKNDIQNLEKEKAELVEKNKKIAKAHKDLKKLVYRGADDVERLQKILQDTDVQFCDAMQQIKDMLVDKDHMQKELEHFKVLHKPSWRWLKFLPMVKLKRITSGEASRDSPESC
ncbi:hypothetical protein C2845_PM09G10310 [Panicum miliaceum]|uniref:Uncharacterized protein n=1 Tax=Panicum miliaceum TaxID=4540 RepID=A0A3L6RYV5_PANMI|nr:hypothetical protein C2845_PM09G10310 [Panicum miliaceum]